MSSKKLSKFHILRIQLHLPLSHQGYWVCYTLEENKQAMFHDTLRRQNIMIVQAVFNYGALPFMSNSMNKLERYISEKGPIESTDTRLLHQAAYEGLKNAAKLAGLQPGELLSEGRIAKAFGISRTPVREAIRRLAKDGVVR
jgi:hypothetical protein